MTFQRGMHHPHPPRGPARKPYRMSEAALRQRRRNLKRTRIRSDRETAIIKRLIWQACFDCGERLSQRALARQLGVQPSYVCKVRRKALSEGMDSLLGNAGPVSLDDLASAKHFTEKLRAEAPDILAPAPHHSPPNQLIEMATEESIADTWREVVEWKRQNLWRCDNRVRIKFAIPR